MLQYIVFFGAAIQLVGGILYCKAVITGRAKPNLITWLLWAISPLIGTAAALSDGVSWSILPTFMAGLCPLLVFIVALFSPKAYWKLTWFDYICGVCSVIACVIWMELHHVIFTTIFAILADLLAAIPTLIKSWRYPASETISSYITGLVSNIFSLWIISSWKFTAYAFPIYLIIINLCLTSIVLWKKTTTSA